MVAINNNKPMFIVLGSLILTFAMSLKPFLGLASLTKGEWPLKLINGYFDLCGSLPFES
jgi:hypothetical protein